MPTFLGTPNKVTIFNGATDAPFNDPLGNLGLVKFDSTFRYLPFLPAGVISQTVNIPATIPGGARGRIITLGAHGQPGVPFIQGYTSPDIVIPLVGTIRILSNANGNMVTWTLGVNATNVFIAEERSFPSSIGTSFNFPVTVFISSRLAA